MAIKATEEQLEEVQNAITKVMLGQVVNLDGHDVTRADLKVLSQREADLRYRYSLEQGTFVNSVNAVDGDV